MTKNQGQKARWKKLFLNPHPYKTAMELAKQKVTIKEYEELQAKRLNRLKFFKSKNVKVLIDTEKDLYEWGEEVLKHLKGIYSMNN